MWFVKILLRKLITCLVNCGDNQLQKIHKLSEFRFMGISLFPTIILVFPSSKRQASKLLLSLFPLSTHHLTGLAA